MKDYIWWIVGGVGVIVLALIFRPKKKRQRSNRKKTTQSKRSRSTSRKSSTGGSRIKKEAGLATAKKYADMNQRQKRLYNLAKARLARKRKKS